MQSRKGAQKRKGEVPPFFATFAYFAPLRETGLSVRGLIHSSFNAGERFKPPREGDRQGNKRARVGRHSGQNVPVGRPPNSPQFGENDLSRNSRAASAAQFTTGVDSDASLQAGQASQTGTK